MSDDARGEDWRAGTASAVITPREPTWLAGYAARTEPSRGTLSELYAKAIALEDGNGGQLLIVTADVIALPKWFVEPVAQRVARSFGVPRERMVFCASHTHYGPEIRPDKVLFFQIPPEYAAKIEPYGAELQDALERVMSDALRDLAPARLYYTQTSAGFAHNRRPHGDVHDHDVPVLDVRDARDEPKAIVFGYACHNTCIPHEDRRFSSDWSGAACQRLEARWPGATAFFLTGAGADQNADPRGSVELSQGYGTELADAVETAMRGQRRFVGGPIGMAAADVPLAFIPVTRDALEVDLASDDPPRQRKARYLLELLDRGESLPADHPYPIQAISLGGDLLLIALSCEPVVDWSLKLKQRFAGRNVWVAGYCNDMFGYVPTRRVQQEGGYEGGRATLWGWVPGPFADDVEDRVTAGVDDVVARVLEGAPPQP